MGIEILGAVGSALAAALTALIANRIGRGGHPGHLRYGFGVWATGAASLAFAMAPIVSTLMGHDQDTWAKAAIVVLAGTGAIWCLLEAALVRGGFDGREIVFFSPWTGARRQRWQDLVSVAYSSTCSWYTLSFEDGTKIRLSQYLDGHLAALQEAQRHLEQRAAGQSAAPPA